MVAHEGEGEGLVVAVEVLAAVQFAASDQGV